MVNPRIPIRCKGCKFLMVEFEEKTNGSFTPYSYGGFGVEAPDPHLRVDGIALAVCSRCGGETEFPAKYLLRDNLSTQTSHQSKEAVGSKMEDAALLALLESIKELCVLNFVEIQHLKKILRRHLKIDEDLGLYKQSVDEYLGRLEQDNSILLKAVAGRERLGQEGAENPKKK